MNKAKVSSEWSHLFNVKKVKREPITVNIKPAEDEVKNLTRRLGVFSLDSLEADFTISQPAGSAAYHVQGHLKGQVTVQCRVSLDELVQDLSEDFEGWYAESGSVVSFKRAQHNKKAEVAGAELEVLDESEDPEPLIEGCIDLGDLATQYLSLAIDQYPQKDGVEYDGPVADHADTLGKDDLKANPFAALKELRKSDE